MKNLKIFIKQFVFPASILGGTIIGAGMFTLPRVFAEIGYVMGLLYFGLFAAVFSLVHLMYADIILRSGGKLQFAAYARRYLGNWSFGPVALISTIGFFLSLTIYLSLSSSFVGLIFPVNIQFSILIFWALASFVIFFEVRKVAFLELLIIAGKIILIGILFYLGLQQSGTPLSHVTAMGNPSNWGLSLLILPFGPILFSLAGRAAITSFVSYFRAERIPTSFMKSAIVWGTIIPVFIYLLFIVGVAGLSGSISADSISGLVASAHSSYAVLCMVGLLGVIALFGTYVLIGRAIQDSLVNDLYFPKWNAALLVVALPPMLYFVGLNNFFSLVSIVGGIFIACEALFIVLVWQGANHAKKERKLIMHLGEKTALAIFLILFVGLAYEIISLFSLAF